MVSMPLDYGTDVRCQSDRAGIRQRESWTGNPGPRIMTQVSASGIQVKNPNRGAGRKAGVDGPADASLDVACRVGNPVPRAVRELHADGLDGLSCKK